MNLYKQVNLYVHYACILITYIALHKYTASSHYYCYYYYFSEWLTEPSAVKFVPTFHGVWYRRYPKMKKMKPCLYVMNHPLTWVGVPNIVVSAYARKQGEKVRFFWVWASIFFVPRIHPLWILLLILNLSLISESQSYPCLKFGPPNFCVWSLCQFWSSNHWFWFMYYNSVANKPIWSRRSSSWTKMQSSCQIATLPKPLQCVVFLADSTA